MSDLKSLEPTPTRTRFLRKRLSLKEEFTLAVLPLATVLLVLFLIEPLTQQPLLFSSLASSAFFIYLEPRHGANTIRSIAAAHMIAALLGLFFFLMLGPGYTSASVSFISTVILLILFDTVHPPAVGTSLSFALKANNISNLALFGMAVMIIAILVFLEVSLLRILSRFKTGRPKDRIS